MSQALHDVICERARQKENGYTEDHDDEHEPTELVRAAASYALSDSPLCPALWPWEEVCWNPKDYRTNWIRAAALLIAAAEVVDRQKARTAREAVAK